MNSHEPFDSKSYWYPKSPHSIAIESRFKVMRMKEMITDQRSSWLLHKFYLTASLEICKEQSEEKRLLMFRCKGLYEICVPLT